MSTDSTGQRPKSRLTKEAAEAIAKLRNDRGFWDELTHKLFGVAVGHIKRRTWPGDYKPQPEHMVADAIHAILFGEVTWRPQVCGLFNACCGVIWSRVDQEFQKSKRFQNVVRDGESGEDLEGEADSYSATAIWSETPLEAMISGENWNELQQLLPSEVSEENQLLRLLVEEIVFSYPEREQPKPGNRPRKSGWANQELAAKLNVSESAIVNAKRRLDRILEDWLWERFIEALPSDGRPWLALVDAAQSAGLSDDWKQTFAGKHSLSLGQVVAMGMELLELLHDWLERTIRDAGTLQKRANRIEKNILASE